MQSTVNKGVRKKHRELTSEEDQVLRRLRMIGSAVDTVLRHLCSCNYLHILELFLQFSHCRLLFLLRVYERVLTADDPSMMRCCDSLQRGLKSCDFILLGFVQESLQVEVLMPWFLCLAQSLLFFQPFLLLLSTESFLLLLFRARIDQIRQPCIGLLRTSRFLLLAGLSLGSGSDLFKRDDCRTGTIGAGSRLTRLDG